MAVNSMDYFSFGGLSSIVQNITSHIIFSLPSSHSSHSCNAILLLATFPFSRPVSAISILSYAQHTHTQHPQTTLTHPQHTRAPRLQPFSNMAVALQGGHFDKPDRLFMSIEQSWLSASSMNLQVLSLVRDHSYYRSKK